MSAETDKILWTMVFDIFDISKNTRRSTCRICEEVIFNQGPDCSANMDHVKQVHADIIRQYSSRRILLNESKVLSFFTVSPERARCKLCQRFMRYLDDEEKTKFLENHLRFGHALEKNDILTGFAVRSYVRNGTEVPSTSRPLPTATAVVTPLEEAKPDIASGLHDINGVSAKHTDVRLLRKRSKVDYVSLASGVRVDGMEHTEEKPPTFSSAQNSSQQNGPSAVPKTEKDADSSESAPPMLVKQGTVQKIAIGVSQNGQPRRVIRIASRPSGIGPHIMTLPKDNRPTSNVPPTLPNPRLSNLPPASAFPATPRRIVLPAGSFKGMDVRHLENKNLSRFQVDVDRTQPLAPSTSSQNVRTTSRSPDADTYDDSISHVVTNSTRHSKYSRMEEEMGIYAIQSVRRPDMITKYSSMVCNPGETVEDGYNRVANNEIIDRFYEKTMDNEMKCQYCYRKFANKSQHILLSHIEKSHPLVSREDALKRNNELGTSVNTYPSDLMPDIAPYFVKANSKSKCVICGFVFKIGNPCLYHMKTAHQNILQTLTLRPSADVTRDLRMGINEKNLQQQVLNPGLEAVKRPRQSGYASKSAPAPPPTGSSAHLKCDEFLNIGHYVFQCTLCDQIVKTTTIAHLHKHLRNAHSVFKPAPLHDFDDEPLVKKVKTAAAIPHRDESYHHPPNCEDEWDYVWNFFEIKGNLIVCMICGLDFQKKTNLTLSKHLQMIHPSVYKETREMEADTAATASGSRSPTQNTCYTYRKGKPLKAERQLVNFLISHGVSQEVANDPQLLTIQQTLNRQSQMPNVAYFNSVIDELVIDTRKAFKVNCQTSVMVTVDYVEDTDNYLAFSIHHVENKIRRVNKMFLRKMIQDTVTWEAIDEMIKEVLVSHAYENTNITHVVFNPKLKSIVPTENLYSHSCLYSTLCSFATAVLKLQVIEPHVLVFKQFISKIRNSKDLYTKFELLRKANGTKIDLTLSSSDDWKTIHKFLKQSFEDSNFTMFSTFSRRWKIEPFLNVEQVTAIQDVIRVLDAIEKEAHLVSAPDNSVLDIIPCHTRLLECVSKIEQEPIATRCVVSLNTIFMEYMTPSKATSKEESNKTAEKALYIDPRRAWLPTMCEGAQKWNLIEIHIKDMMLKTELEMWKDDADEIPMDEIIRINKAIGADVNLYQTIVRGNRPTLDTDVKAWWKDHQYQLPMLSKVAYELMKIPASAVDATQYFGRKGKYNYVCSTMAGEQLRNTLEIVSRNEKYISGGYNHALAENLASGESDNITEDDEGPSRAPPMPERIASLACANPQIKEMERQKRHEERQNEKRFKKNGIEFIRHSANARAARMTDEDPLDPWLMQPPPRLSPETNPQLAFGQDAKQETKTEELEVKKEITDNGYDASKTSKTSPTPAEPVVKDEIIEDDSEYAAALGPIAEVKQEI